MLNIHLIHESRTEHAKVVRRLTGTNDFRDKEWHLRQGCLMQYRYVSHYRQSDCNMLRIRIAAFRGRTLNGDGYSNIQRMEINGVGTSNTLTSTGKDNMALITYD